MDIEELKTAKAGDRVTISMDLILIKDGVDDDGDIDAKIEDGGFPNYYSVKHVTALHRRLSVGDDTHYLGNDPTVYRVEALYRDKAAISYRMVPGGDAYHAVVDAKDLRRI